VDYLVFDDLNLTTARTRIGMNSPQGVLEIHFAGPEPEGLKSGDLLEVNGIRLGANVAAQDAALQEAVPTVCAPTGEQKIAAILATFPGVPPPNITASNVYQTLFGSSSRSVDGYWREASYGNAWATGTAVGWYTLDKVYSCDQYYNMLTAAMTAADADIDFRNYNRVFVIFPNPGGCGWAGLSNVGCRSYASPGDGSFTASASWMLANYFTDNDQGVKLSIHEAGHGLGLMHSRSRDFGAEALGPVGATGTLAGYGDIFSAMGSWNLGHYAAEQKLKLGWLPTMNVATVQSPGVFNVLPAETPAAGIQALKVQRGTDSSYLWVEYRRPTGNYDSSLPSQVFSGGLVHYHDTTTSSYTDLLDYTPATSSFSDPALAAGSTWVDPYTNVSLTVTSATASGLGVSVNYGSAPCVSAAPSITATPPNPSANAGASVNYTLTVKNNDTAGCTSSAFSLSSTLPAGWSTTFSSSALTIAPGQSASATMTKTVPAGTEPATYPVDATATGPSSSATASVNVSVVPPLPPLSVTVASSAPAYPSKSVAILTAKALNGSAPAVGASVKFTLTKPGGAHTELSAKADSAGKAQWNYRFGPKDPKGTYTLAAQGTNGNQTATSPPITFTMQ
jgi:M6 family metalloprotease-like protein